MSLPSEPTPGSQLARLLRGRGIRDARVLDAIARVPRIQFLPREQHASAGEDHALPIGCDQTISQPFIVAVMTTELALTGTERVLEIGTGSGYQTAVVARLAAEVFTIERHLILSLRARSVLDRLGYTNVHFHVGDGTLGWPQDFRFDRIIITAAAPKVPTPVFDQLCEGGLMILPLGDEMNQRLTVVRKRDERANLRAGLACRFVPLIGHEGWNDTGA